MSSSTELLPWEPTAGVGPGNHPHSQPHGLLHRLDMVLPELPRFHLRHRVAFCGVVREDRQGRHQRHILVGHHPEQVMVEVEVATMLNGVHTGLHGGAESRPSDGMAGNQAALGVRLGHQGFEFSQVVAGVGSQMGGPPEPGLEDLDEVGAHPCVFANRGANLVGSVSDTVWDGGIGHFVPPMA